MSYGFIRCTQTWDEDLKTRSVSCELEGGTVAMLDPWTFYHATGLNWDDMPKLGQSFQLYNLRLTVVGQDSWGNLVVRQNRRGVRWFALCYTVGQIVRLFKCRLIATCRIWRLARFDDSEIPQWRHIHAVRWVMEKLGREG
jgi:hypothetical protein